MAWHVLYLDHADLMGGAERSLLLLLRHVDRGRVEPLLGCTPGTPLEQAARAAGIPVAPVPFGPVRRRDPARAAAGLVRGVVSLARLARAEEVALIHSNVARATIYGVGASLATSIPLVWHVRDIHDSGRPGEWLLVQAAARTARRILCISGATARPLPRSVRGKVCLVPNGLDPSRFDPAAARPEALRAAWGVAPGEVLVGTVGWLAPWKQVEHFLQMASQVGVGCPMARFVVVGDASSPRYVPYVEQLKAQARTALGDRVRFVGAQADVPSVMHALDILVHTARAEPFGRVLLEAMAMERPVVAYADGGVPDIVQEGRTGHLARPGDVAELARLVTRLIQDPGARREMGQAGRARVLQCYSAEQVARRVEGIYETVLERS